MDLLSPSSDLPRGAGPSYLVLCLLTHLPPPQPDCASTGAGIGVWMPRGASKRMAASGTPRKLPQSTVPGPTTDLGPGHLHCKVARLLNLCPRAGEVGLCMSSNKRAAAHRGLPPVRAGLCAPSCPTPCWRASASSTRQESSPGRSRGSAEVSEAPGMVGSGSMRCSLWYVL